ncbi:MAG: hypothetical protein NZ932_03995 [Candidatus Bathyarchaeota archaeon]|nr:hypothetical protein [Candidatus Bathyarchaeota archaeon]MDW8022369.1 hypothetical protein [Nitrososphaerota archaeon]
MNEEEQHFTYMHGVLFRPAKATAIDFKENIVDWILRCRVDDGGIPMFRTGFANRPFTEAGTNYVLGICWLGANLVNSQWFQNVPDKDFKHMREHHDDYIYLLRKYGGKQALEKALKSEITVV